jgi:hypothetical protein
MAPVWAALVLASIARQTLALHFDAVDAKNYPVSKVVALLNDMKVQLEKEQDADEEIYSKMACWCETNNKGKTKAIADAEARIATLDNTIEKMTSLSLTLNEEIKGLEKEIAANQKSLDVATALRAKQLAEFNAEEKEMLQSISALKSAVVVLGKHHDGSAAAFLNNKVILKAFATAKALQDKHMVLLQGTITPSQKRLISSLAQDQGPTSAAYKPQSGQIFGILNQMKETFEADLSNSAKEELASAAAYKDLKAAKEEEIAAGTQSLEQKTQQLATTDETNAQAKEDKEDTEASLGADQKFLMDLKERCALSDEAWEKRQKERHVELEAVAKAISILSSDDARDQFSKTYNPSFLQVSAEGASQRKQAANVLAKFPKLAALATSVRLDPFTDVKKAIDKMIIALEKESAEEVKHKDYCLDGLQENEVDVQKKTHSKVNLETKIAALQQTIKETKTAIQNVVTEIEDLKTQQKRAVEDRAAEKKEFEGVVADQRETQNLLNQALDVLKDVYGDGVVLVQVGQEPPAGFDTYKKSTGSTGVIALLNQIIADTKEMEAAAMHDEQTAAEEHTKFMKATLESLKAKDDIKVDLTEQKAKSEKELTEAKSELDGTMTELENLGNEAGALHKSCDYTLKNFDVRQTARDEEVDALRKAKAFLSGMKA